MKSQTLEENSGPKKHQKQSTFHDVFKGQLKLKRQVILFFYLHRKSNNAIQ